MWVNREQYEANLKRTAKLEVEVESNIREIARLRVEIDYWRAKFESALNRADRIVDKSLTVSGLGPVSDLGVKELTETTSRYEEMMKKAVKENTEMFAEEIPGAFSEGEEEKGLQIDENLLAGVVSGLRE